MKFRLLTKFSTYIYLRAHFSHLSLTSLTKWGSPQSPYIAIYCTTPLFFPCFKSTYSLLGTLPHGRFLTYFRVEVHFIFIIIHANMIFIKNASSSGNRRIMDISVNDEFKVNCALYLCVKCFAKFTFFFLVKHHLPIAINAVLMHFNIFTYHRPLWNCITGDVMSLSLCILTFKIINMKPT